MLIKTLANSFKTEKEAIKIPKSTQQSIPVKRIYKDGVWKIGQKYSKTWLFSDINYSIASESDKEDMFFSYSNLINSLSTDAITKITINNHKLNKSAFRKNLLMGTKGDFLDFYRNEYNRMLMEKAESGNGIVQEKYVTISAVKKNIEEARAFFNRVNTDLTANFGKLSSISTRLNNTERLRVIHDFFNMDKETDFEFNLSDCVKKGHDFKDEICPSNLRFKASYFEVNDKVGRVLFLKDFASFISDEMIYDFCNFSRNLMLSIDILPTPTDEAVKDLKNKLLAIETDITRWQRKQNENNNFSAAIPYDYEEMREEIKEVMDGITKRDQRMTFAIITIVHVADTIEELDSDTETLESISKGHSCELSTLKYQQEDGLNTVLPYGHRKIEAVRTMLTESTAMLMPFSVQEIQDRGGIYYGNNAVSNNPIICNRKNLLNGNGFILGVSGSGKSFAAKEEIAFIALNTDDDILICDPEREYSPLIRELGGEVINISAGSTNHINALDMSRDYENGENPLISKSEFIMSLCEQLAGAGSVGAKEKSIIDRAVTKIYNNYLIEKGASPPTLPDFRMALLNQDEPEAKDIALAIELFTNGNLNVFAHQTNVNMNNRIILFDILDLGKQLKTVGMLVMLDAILNRVMENRKKGKRTWIYIDEIYLFFANEYSSGFLSESWKRFRKYGALATGITQNIEDCLRSPTARTMLANSEFLLMLNQAATDREELAKLIKMSDDQLSHITNSGAGRGIIKVGGVLVPFVNEFSKELQLYKLMSTRPGEN